MERTNELLTAINKYFSSDEGTSIKYHGTGALAKEFADVFQFGEKFIGDAPDMFICKNNVAFIIEHFEFDCYRATRKGSQNRREQSRIERLEKSSFQQKPVSIFTIKYTGLHHIKTTLTMCVAILTNIICKLKHTRQT